MDLDAILMELQQGFGSEIYLHKKGNKILLAEKNNRPVCKSWCLCSLENAITVAHYADN